MTAATLAGISVELDAEGFLVDPSTWTEELAAELARESGIPELTPRHWQVVNYMRNDLPRDRPGAVDPLARQAVRRPHQGAVRAFPQGAGEARRHGSAGSPSPAAASERRNDDDHRARPRATRPGRPAVEPKPIEKVSIVISKGSLEGDLSRPDHGQRRPHGRNRGERLLHLLRARRDHAQAPGDTSRSRPSATPGCTCRRSLGALPGMSWIATKMMARKMEKLDIPPVPEFVEMIADSGAGIYGCKATVDMFGLARRGLRPSGRPACSPWASSTSSRQAARSSSRSAQLDMRGPSRGPSRPELRQPLEHPRGRGGRRRTCRSWPRGDRYSNSVRRMALRRCRITVARSRNRMGSSPGDRTALPTEAPR